MSSNILIVEDVPLPVYFITNVNYIKKTLFSYIDNLSSSEILFKTNYKLNNIHNKKHVLEFYIQNIIPFTVDEKRILVNYTEILNTYVKDTSLFNKYKWKFVKVSVNIEYKMPFTYGDIIFLPESFLLNISKDTCLEILLHEKIHIIQRYNENLFDKFYITKLNIIVNNIIISNDWMNVKFTNPDGINIKYIYIYNDEYILPLLISKNISKNKKLEKIGIILKKQNNNYITTSKYYILSKIKSELFKDYPEDCCLYHPNEISACIIPKIILNKTLNLKIKDKFNFIMKYL